MKNKKKKKGSEFREKTKQNKNKNKKGRKKKEKKETRKKQFRLEIRRYRMCRLMVVDGRVEGRRRKGRWSRALRVWCDIG